jgi:Flp pilus assembly protein TadB
VIVLASLAGATFALGLLLMVFGFVGTSAPPPPRRRLRDLAARASAGSISRRRLALSIGVPLLVLALTRWPVAALLAAAATVGLPPLLNARRVGERRIARLQALAEWTRRLSDVLAAGAGIEAALEATLRSVPPPIEPELRSLVAQLRARRPLEEALLGFGDALADPTGDLVVAALLLATRRRGRGLARSLTQLATTVDAEVAMRRGVEADRAQPRATARYVVYLTMAVAGGLLLLNRDYVAPFGTLVGQLVLTVVGLLFAVSFAWMYQLTGYQEAARFLPAEPSGAGRRP